MSSNLQSGLERGRVEPHFLELMQRVCARPAMYVGTTSFNRAAIFLSGYDAGMYSDVHSKTLHFGGILQKYFRIFLVAKYGTEAAIRRRAEKLAQSQENDDDVDLDDDGKVHPLYQNIGWESIYHQHFPGKDDKELLTILLQDFQDFANPLTRMATEVT